MNDKKNSKFSYKDSGVDINEGYKAVELYKKFARETFDKYVSLDIGSFGSLYKLPQNEDFLLVSSTDGVGTKLELAFKLKKYDTVGIDCVAMCVNDIICLGAKPLFFLDYLACGKLDHKIAGDLVKGIAEGCKIAGCSLIGGETAEMPGFYEEGKYDIAGFTVGIVHKKDLIDGSKIKEGDILISIESSGFHSNGYSLLRKIINDNKIDLNSNFGESTIGLQLLKPTFIYVNPILECLRNKIEIKGIANITGGGFYENIPRMFKDNFTAIIEKDKIKLPKIMEYFKSFGISDKEMFNTFNCGTGMVLCVKDKNDFENIRKIFEKYNLSTSIIGKVAKGEKETKIIGIDL
ncbi:MAG: phosphoribosylformylglycinamidine cyclo-ligase [Spirochaetes bacterium]|nr:phosphoribosylformylglycinamidine cyclo-ligase [Spirochaetota bacterium]